MAVARHQFLDTLVLPVLCHCMSYDNHTTTSPHNPFSYVQHRSYTLHALQHANINLRLHAGPHTKQCHLAGIIDHMVIPLLRHQQEWHSQGQSDSSPKNGLHKYSFTLPMCLALCKKLDESRLIFIEMGCLCTTPQYHGLEEICCTKPSKTMIDVCALKLHFQLC